MNNLSHAFTPERSHQQTQPQNPFNSSIYQKEMSIRSQQSSSTDLVIETKEGDRVTLSASNFASMSGYTYNGKGLIETESGGALFSHNYREITLSSGQSFSFAVEGDLSEEEIGDIESLLKGLDKVMTKMRHGDIFGAMDKALEIGSFDSVSSYSADLSFSSTYEMSSSTYAAAAQSLPEQSAAPPVEAVEGSGAQTPIDFDSFFTKLLEQLEAHENRLAGLTRNPIEKLFDHHIEDAKKNDEESPILIEALKTARDELTALIEELASANRIEQESTEEKSPTVQPAEEK